MQDLCGTRTSGGAGVWTGGGIATEREQQLAGGGARRSTERRKASQRDRGRCIAADAPAAALPFWSCAQRSSLERAEERLKTV